jgi:hypothetical protein
VAIHIRVGWAAAMNAKSGVSAATSANATRSAPRIFRLPLGPRLLSVFGVTVLGLATGIIIAFAVFAFTQQWVLGLFMMAVACFIAALTGYVWRDLSGKWGLWLALDADAVTLNLPAGRSLIHRPPMQHLTIRYADIESIETRLEAYGSLGVEMMQRAYVLRRKNNDLIFLFEDRALGTGMASSLFTNIASELAARAGGQAAGHWYGRGQKWLSRRMGHARTGLGCALAAAGAAVATLAALGVHRHAGIRNNHHRAGGADNRRRLTRGHAVCLIHMPVSVAYRPARRSRCSRRQKSQSDQ